MNLKETQKQKQTGGALFEEQNSRKTASPPMTEENVVEVAGNDISVNNVPAPVDTGAGGSELAPYDPDFISKMIDPAQNLEVFEGGGSVFFPAIKIVKDLQVFHNQADGETFRKFQGLAIAISNPKALWFPKDHPQNPTRGTESKFPHCHSIDGKKPVHFNISENGCGDHVCQYDAFGSIRLIKPDEDGAGKACKNSVAIIVIPLGFAKKDEDQIPEFTKEDFMKILRGETELFKMVGSPKSINEVKKYIQFDLTTKSGKIWHPFAMTEFSLRKITEPHVYSVLQLRCVGTLEKMIIDIANNEPGGPALLAEFKKSIELTQKYLKDEAFVVDKEDVLGEDPF